MSFDQFQHLVVLLASGCCTNFPTDLIGNLFNIENLVLKARQEFHGFASKRGFRFQCSGFIFLFSFLTPDPPPAEHLKPIDFGS